MKYSWIILIVVNIGCCIYGAVVTSDTTCTHNGQSYHVGEEFYVDMCMKCASALRTDSTQTQLNCHMVEKCLHQAKENVLEHGCYYGTKHILYGQEKQVTEILRCWCEPESRTGRAKCRLHFGRSDKTFKNRVARFLAKYSTPAPPKITTKGTTKAPPPFTTRVPPNPATTNAPPTPAFITTHAHGSTKSPPPLSAGLVG